jgi:hypothetical protein
VLMRAVAVLAANGRNAGEADTDAASKPTHEARGPSKVSRITRLCDARRPR